jgi:outer membrane protein assembly factor BamC
LSFLLNANYERELLMRLKQYQIFVLFLTTIFTLGACTSSLTKESIDYKTQGEKKTPNLSIPSDLSVPNLDKKYSVTDGPATLSQYNAAAAKGKPVADRNTVTPRASGL